MEQQDQFSGLSCPTCSSPQPSMHPAVSDGGEVTNVCLDLFHGPPPAAVLAPTGVVIKTPEELAAEGDRLPYAKANRTPEGPLLELHAFAAAQLQVNPDMLVSLEGRIGEHGSVALFAVNPGETAALIPTGYVIASFDVRRSNRFRVQARVNEQLARVAYAQRVQVCG